MENNMLLIKKNKDVPNCVILDRRGFFKLQDRYDGIYVVPHQDAIKALTSSNKEIERLKNFGIWIDETNTIKLAKDIYTEGGKNEEVHRATRELKSKLQKQDNIIKGMNQIIQKKTLTKKQVFGK